MENKLGAISDADRVSLSQLMQALDFIPLAISQAAAYIRATVPRSSIKKYIDELRKSERARTSIFEHDAAAGIAPAGRSGLECGAYDLVDLVQSSLRTRETICYGPARSHELVRSAGDPGWVLNGNKPRKVAMQGGDRETAGTRSVRNTDIADSELDGHACSNSDTELEDDIAMLKDYSL